MTVYRIADRAYETGPNGVTIWTIPGRPVVTDTLCDAKASAPTKKDRAMTLAHVVAYLIEHPVATVAELTTPRIHSKTLWHVMRNNPALFEACGKTAQYGANLWRLKR